MDNSPEDLPPPFDESAEAGVLGCVLCAASGEAEAMLEKLHLEDFYDLRHQIVFGALRSLAKDRKALNPITLHQWLVAQGELQTSDALAYIARLPDLTPSPENFTYFFETLKDLGFRRSRIRDYVEGISLHRDRRIPLANLVDVSRRMAEVHLKSQSPKKLSIWKPSEFLAWVAPASSNLLLPAYLTRSELTTLIGQPGIGKTRLALHLAICQILGREWCGLTVSAEPMKWLFLGDENSISRWQDDLRHMFSALTAQEIERVDEFLFLPAILGPDDADVWLGDARTQDRIIQTIEGVEPGAVVADPLGNFAPDDISKPGPMKEAVRLLLHMMRRSAPEAAYTILHHARSGRQNIIQGVGWDAGNFASGGKALIASSRCQMNLMPGSADDDTKLVLSCAKSNNCERFTTRGLIFDRETFTYSMDPEFDLEAWTADVEGRARSGQSLCTVAEVASAVHDGYSTTKALVEHLTEACATSKSTVERMIRRATDCEAVAVLSRGKFMLGRKSTKYLEARN